MSNKLKAAWVVFLVALIALAAVYVSELGGNPVPDPIPTVTPSSLPSPSPSPSLIPSSKVQVLDSWDRPETSAAADWKSNTSRVILTGQLESVILRSSAPCELVTVPGIQKMLPLVITNPSAPSYQAGTYYDSLRPLTTANCADAKYLQLDVTSSAQVGDATITIVKKLQAPATPSVKLDVEFNNWIMVKAYCGGVWCSAEAAGKQATQLLKDHGLSSYKAYPGAAFSWLDYQYAFNQGSSTFVSAGAVSGAASALAALPASARAPYAYVKDEPSWRDDTALVTLLEDWTRVAPHVEPMVTMSLRRIDYNSTSPTYGKVVNLPPRLLELVKVFTPVAERFCVETWKGSGDWLPCRIDYAAAAKKVRLYISNMSHGADTGPATGAPDLVIDRTAVEAFGFYLLALKYDLDGLLYYNSIQGWDAIPGRDVNVDPYQFGGWGDGLLLMPDRAARLAYPTIRLKLLRAASQWADVMLLAKAKDPAWFAAKMAALMRTPLDFERNVSAFRAAYLEAMAKL